MRVVNGVDREENVAIAYAGRNERHNSFLETTAVIQRL